MTADRASKPLHVALLIDRWDPDRGGAERALATLSEHLVGRGHRVTAFGVTGRSAAGATFSRVPVRGLARAARERSLARGMVAAARAAGCDVTVGVRHLEQVDLYWPHGGSHAAALAARRRARGKFAERAPRGRHRSFVDFERALLAGGGARRVVCVSAMVRDEFERAWPGCGESLVVIENGVDLERFHLGLREPSARDLRARLSVPAGTPLIAFAGREPVLKGLPVLLAALVPLSTGARADRPWHLVVAGPKDPAYWRRAAASLGLGADRVSVFAHLPPAELLAGADLCGLPTWRDPCPLVVLEALACGTPVIATRRAGNASLVRAPVAGAVLEGPEDVAALTAALDLRLARETLEGVDRAAVRACVEHRGRGPWMERLERELLALAR